MFSLICISFIGDLTMEEIKKNESPGNISKQKTQENQKKRFIILMQMIHQMQSALIVGRVEKFVLISIV
jgi:hypothetical protein